MPFDAYTVFRPYRLKTMTTLTTKDEKETLARSLIRIDINRMTVPELQTLLALALTIRDSTPVEIKDQHVFILHEDHKEQIDLDINPKLIASIFKRFDIVVASHAYLNRRYSGHAQYGGTHQDSTDFNEHMLRVAARAFKHDLEHPANEDFDCA